MDDAERAFRDALHRVDAVKIPVPSLEPADVRRKPGLGIMMGRWLAAAAVLAVVAGLAVWELAGRGQVVTGVPATPTSAAAPARLTGTTWIAVEFHGKPTDLAGNKLPFIEFRTDSTYRGGDPCNGVGGSYRLVGNDLRISPPGAMTEMGCNVAQQQAFIKVLGDTRRVYRDGETIELLDQAGSVLARFRSSEAYTTPGPTPTPTRVQEETPTPSTWAPGTDREIRIRNASNVDFTDVYALFPSGQKVHYGPIPAGSASTYAVVTQAYSSTYLEVVAGGKTYKYQPIDHVGESELPIGRYSYALNVDGSRIDLTLEFG